MLTYLVFKIIPEARNPISFDRGVKEHVRKQWKEQKKVNMMEAKKEEGKKQE